MFIYQTERLNLLSHRVVKVSEAVMGNDKEQTSEMIVLQTLKDTLGVSVPSFGHCPTSSVTSYGHS